MSNDIRRRVRRLEEKVGSSSDGIAIVFVSSDGVPINAESEQLLADAEKSGRSVKVCRLRVTSEIVSLV